MNRATEIRLSKVEHYTAPDDGRFFLVWGLDAKDVESRIGQAVSNGDLEPGDRLYARIWADLQPMPASRRTVLTDLSDAELRAIASLAAGERPQRPSPSEHLCHFSDHEIAVFFAARCSAYQPEA